MVNTLLVVGLACVIAGIIGGGLKLAGVDIPHFESRIRQGMLGALGVVLIAGAVYLTRADWVGKPEPPIAASQPRPSNDAPAPAATSVAAAKPQAPATQVAQAQGLPVQRAQESNRSSADRIRAYWKPGGDTVDAQHAAEINAWLASNASEVSIPFFIYGAGSEAQQAAMIRALQIP